MPELDVTTCPAVVPSRVGFLSPPPLIPLTSFCPRSFARKTQHQSYNHKALCRARLTRSTTRGYRQSTNDFVDMHRSRRAGKGSIGSPDRGSKPSIRLTVKAPPSRLREIKSTSPESDQKTKRETLSRSSKNKKPIVDPPSDEDEDEEMEEQDRDEETDDDLEDGDDDEDLDDEDEAMPDATPEPNRPTIRISAPTSRAAHNSIPPRGLKGSQTKLMSVEDKEMTQSSRASSSKPSALGENAADDDDEDENENEQDEEDDEEEDDEDEEGQPPPPDLTPFNPEILDDDRADTIKADTLNSSDLDTDSSELSASGSRSGTPDLSKLTRRQRAGLDYNHDGSLLALSNEAQKKKFFTAEQITMRRAEMARRRKDLSEKRNQEEKEDTLKRLLEKPAPKRRSRAQMVADAEREEFGVHRADAVRIEGFAGVPVDRLCVRTVYGSRGTRVGVPEDWLGAPVGEVFGWGMGEDGKPKLRQGRDGLKVVKPGRMVEVVE